MFGYAFSKLAMTFSGFVVQVHQVSVTLDAEAEAEAIPVPPSTPNSVAAVALTDRNFLSFMVYPLG
jgi:hypothetical protein